MIRRMILLTLCLLLLCVTSALADDVCLIEQHDFAAGVETDRNYVRIICPVEKEATVMVSIYKRNGSLAWQRDYGLRSEAVQTEEIYLRLQGVSTTYQAEVRVGDAVYRFPIVRKMARLRNNAACTAGYALHNIAGLDTWESVTMIDVHALEHTAMIVPVYASETYTFGAASMTVQAGALMVSVNPAGGVDGRIDSAKVYVATDAMSAAQFGQKNFSGLTGELNQPIYLHGADLIAVYVDLEVSFDPATAPIGAPEVDPQQEALWQQMISGSVG